MRVACVCVCVRVRVRVRACRQSPIHLSVGVVVIENCISACRLGMKMCKYHTYQVLVLCQVLI